MSDAITRKESLLKSIADGTSSALKPITREEQYLAYIAGESKSFPTTPITREEAFLDKIAKNGAGGGSSINVQPLNVTENGTWDAPDGQAYDPVTVDVKAVTEPITITENGVYPVPKGGGLVEGETYTLKNNLNDIDPNDFMNFPLDNEFIEAYTIFRYDPNVAAGLGYLPQEALSAVLGVEAVSGGWMITPPDVDFEKIYIYPIKVSGADGTLIDNNIGWTSLQGDAVEVYSVTIPSPYDASIGYSLEELAVFFDIKTKSLDGWGDITVNVARGGGAELNIAYGDTAPEDTSKLWVKTSEPSAVKVSGSVSYMGGDEAYNTLEAVLPKSFAGVSAGVVGDKIYLFSGYDGYTWGNQTIYCFDTTTKTISTLSATLPNAYTTMGCAVVGKAIYLLGGMKAGNYSSDIVRFDTETETATLLETKVQDNTTTPTSVAIGTDIWSLGGGQNQCIWKFDTINGTTHSTTAKLSGAKNFRSSLQADGSNIYIFGGFLVMSNKATDSISKFDTITETMTTLNTTLPTAKCLMASTKIGSRIYLFGGATNADSIKSATGTTTVYCFDMETETITTLPITLATGKKGVHSAVTVSETCYIFGGQNTNAIDEFKPNLKVSVVQNNLHILSTMGSNKFNLINTDTAQVEIGVNKVYKGNADGIGEEVEASLHNGTSWVTI